MIKELSFGTLSGGLKNGLVMYEIEVTGDIGVAGETMNVMDILQGRPANLLRRVHIVGDFTRNNSHDMDNLVAALQTMKFEIYVSTKEKFYFQWMKHVQFLSVHIDDPKGGIPYPGFSEIVYTIYSVDQPEPKLPDIWNPTMQPLYLQSGGELKITDLFKYLGKALYTWNINMETKQVRESLYKGSK